MTDIKQEVRQFYDQVGWQLVGSDVYQNAHYEDLRPVSQEYIHRCHLRVARHIKPEGHYFLDAGSGPIQYPQYLEYSRGYQYRVCADISITALREARKRLGDRGLYCVADIANLPFKNDAFEGQVSLHTIHHLPEAEHLQAYQELHRVLAPGSSGAIVNGWPSSRLMKAFEPLMRFSRRLRGLGYGISRRFGNRAEIEIKPSSGRKKQLATDSDETPKGTFTNRHDVAWVKTTVGGQIPLDIYVWRSVSVKFLRTLIQPRLAGRWILKLLYALEERYPHYFGENGQYPLIVIHKT
jgi:SAM-dependent methyltransferase